MSKTCKCAIFDADNWCFNCTLTKNKCISGKHFPDFDNCPRKIDNSFIYDSIKEKFDMLFPEYAKKTIFWSPCRYNHGRGFTSILVIMDGNKLFIFEYGDDNTFGLYATGYDTTGIDLADRPDFDDYIFSKAVRDVILNNFNKKEEV